jgi:hypothetical protein
MMAETRDESDIINTTLLKPIKPSQLLEAIADLYEKWLGVGGG